MNIKSLKRIVNRKRIGMLLTDPQSAVESATHALRNGTCISPESLLERKFVHVAFFGTSNAGDTLLPTVLRDLFNQKVGVSRWKARHVHDAVGKADVEMFNRRTALVVGGGGLFLNDTNKNNVSGWQWPISVEAIRALQTKLIIFAVGYNRFRGQDDFNDVFRQNISELCEKAVFIGLRNRGSMESLASYLPDHLAQKISFQPCMTTVLARIYPELFTETPSNNGPIVLNCAFDRASLRYGDNLEKILGRIAEAMKRLSAEREIAYYSHCKEDEKMLPYLDACGFRYSHVRLYDRSTHFVLDQYKRAGAVIGMRGHSQMIPFGCGIPIVSLISHNKMRWFLEDIGAPEWGVEVQSPDLVDKLYSTTLDVLDDDVTLCRLRSMQDKMWSVCEANCETIRLRMRK